VSATLSPADAAAIVTARERFGIRLGLERMHRLLAELMHPERRYPAIHVVGTNAKSTTARTIEASLRVAGLRVGTYLSPHVVSFAERFRVDGEELELDIVLSPILDAVAVCDRDGPEPVTQFELLTAAGLNAFATHDVDVAVVEAGLGGRFDATNVLGADAVVVTNIALDHQEQLGTTRAAIAEEKLAVIREGATVVLGEPEWEGRARELGAGEVILAHTTDGLAAAAAEALTGRPVAGADAAAVALPGRRELVGDDPPEIWDGAHNPHAVAWLSGQLDLEERVLVLSILADKDVDEMLRLFSELGDVLVATSSSNARALAAAELAARAADSGRFERVEAHEDPLEARGLGRELARARGSSLLVSGSLYLLQELVDIRPRRVP
jgi:dihydrofolate synthase/folylpolyglutamate synthase